MVAGDLNTGGVWKDIRTGPMSHFPIVERLGELGLQSVYHVARCVDQGVDEEPTHWNNKTGPCMIDHVFTPTLWPILTVTVGPEGPWHQRSDHAPLIVEVDPAR